MSSLYEMTAAGVPYAFFFALAGAARSSCIIGLVDRPICLALIAGFITSDWSLALPLGIIFELLWLDALELGVPPYGNLSFLLLFPLCRFFDLTQPGSLLIPLILCMLAAYLASFCEQRQRIWQNAMVDKVEIWCEGKRGGTSPGAALCYSSLRRFFWQIGLYCLCFALIFSLLGILQRHQALPPLQAVTWSALYVAALMGAVLSLRTRQAYVVLVGCLGMLALLIWVGH